MPISFLKNESLNINVTSEFNVYEMLLKFNINLIQCIRNVIENAITIDINLCSPLSTWDV